jgi:hypothetical protein
VWYGRYGIDELLGPAIAWCEDVARSGGKAEVEVPCGGAWNGFGLAFGGMAVSLCSLRRCTYAGWDTDL